MQDESILEPMEKRGSRLKLDLGLVFLWFKSSHQVKFILDCRNQGNAGGLYTQDLAT